MRARLVLKRAFLEAPIANGQAGHLLDYDDTHMGGTLLHASSPILAALFSLAERALVSGAEFLMAYAVGFEAGVRSGRTAPGHHNSGWHLTGTLGALAAAIAAGKLLRLDVKSLTYTMAVAATQSAGMQQNRGTMCKSFHAGKAASSGVLAALLAERGFDGSLKSSRASAAIAAFTAMWRRLTNSFASWACAGKSSATATNLMRAASFSMRRLMR